MIHRARLLAAVFLGTVAVGFAEPAAAQSEVEAGVPTSGAEGREEPEETQDVSGRGSEDDSDCGRVRSMRITCYKNLVLLNVALAFSGRIELEYERALHRRVSIFTAAYVAAFDALLGKRLVGYGGLVGSRVYALGGAPEGLWVSWVVGALYGYARNNRDVRHSAFHTGGMVGWTSVWRRFTFTVGAGAEYTVGRVFVNDASVRDSAWHPWFRLGMGVAF